MLEHQERIALIILAGVLSVLLCVHVVLGIMGHGAFASPFTQSSQEGELVWIEGNVEEVSTTYKGAHSIVVLNGVTIFIPAGIADEITLQQGDRASVIGTVQVYKGEKEIVVKNREDIQIQN